MTNKTPRKTKAADLKAPQLKASRKGATAQYTKHDQPPTKLALVADLLARSQGASLEELCLATGWQAHSVRGAMAGALKRKGLVIISEKQDGVRRYRTGTPS